MAKAFSVASWNVEHFGALDKRTRRPQKPIKPAVDFIAAQNADIVAIYEVRGSWIFRALMEAMPKHHFHITEGPQMQEILVGVRDRFPAFVTQKLQFKAGQTTLRPGVLVTVQVDGAYYPVLFLHLKSMPDPKGFGLRDDMLKRALKFRKALNEASPSGKANYMFAGDLNTMGLDYPYTAHDIDAADEIQELDRRAGYRDMQRLAKTHALTWWNGNDSFWPGSDLDHVVAAEHLEFKEFGGKSVDVRGWIDEGTKAQKRAWIKKYSDHNLLYFEVQKV